jgi:23S rRNA pseudouridine955/2504/2580 synthase
MSDSEKVQLIRVLQPQEGQRLDNFLLRRLKGVPRSRVYWLIRRGEVRVNKKRCKPDRKLDFGDEVRIPPFASGAEQKPGKPTPGLQELLLGCLLYEDEHLLVINKPTGLSVHGGSGVRLGLIEALRQLKPEWATLELAHRLDRDTSGCLVIAKTSEFLKQIQTDLKEKRVQKRYYALVQGRWPEETTVVEAPLLKNELSSGERIVRVAREGKPSLTRFTVLQRFTGATLVEAMPETGRTHQIRVHCQYAGHPIVGDSKYGAKGELDTLNRVKSLCLHAASIRFAVPHLPAPLEVSAPVDKMLESVLASLEKEQ